MQNTSPAMEYKPTKYYCGPNVLARVPHIKTDRQSHHVAMRRGSNVAIYVTDSCNIWIEEMRHHTHYIKPVCVFMTTNIHRLKDSGTGSFIMRKPPNPLNITLSKGRQLAMCAFLLCGLIASSCIVGKQHDVGDNEMIVRIMIRREILYARYAVPGEVKLPRYQIFIAGVLYASCDISQLNCMNSTRYCFRSVKMSVCL